MKALARGPDTTVYSTRRLALPPWRKPAPSALGPKSKAAQSGIEKCVDGTWLSRVSFDGRSGPRLGVGSLPSPSPRRPASADAPPWPPPAPCALSSNRSRSAQYAFSVGVGSDAFISASAFSTSSIAARTFSIIVDSATSRERRLARQCRSGCRPTTSASSHGSRQCTRVVVAIMIGSVSRPLPRSIQLREADESGEQRVQNSMREFDHAMYRPCAKPQMRIATVEMAEIAPYPSRICSIIAIPLFNWAD